MVVWVLIITIIGGSNSTSSGQVTVIDNIQSAESCEQLAKVIRKGSYPSGFSGSIQAVCAPVRKVK